MDFQPGDIVQLKSGGPAMTVAWVEEGEAWCEWFDGKGEPKGGRYRLTSLKKVDP